MKKTISLLLSIVMLLSMTAGVDLSAYADTSGDFEYALLDNGIVCIEKYLGNSKEVIIPSKIDGYKVTSVSGMLFCGNQDIESVKIENGITDIGMSAFDSCTNLKTVYIPISVTFIAPFAFYGTPLKDVYYGGNESDWSNIDIDPSKIGGDREILEQANIHYNYIEPCKTHTWDNGKVTKAATCTAEGIRTYTCVDCNATVTEAIAKTAHALESAVTTKATTGADGTITTTCSVCGETLSTTVIPKASNIQLSKTGYTYNGKVQKPGVTVKDSKGKTLKNGTDYTVSYAKGRKNVGKYAVKVTFKGNYSGSKTLYFTITPKGTSLSKVTAGKKKFTVKWKKQTSQTTGYQMQYSTDKNFKKNNKTVTVTKNKTTSKTISKLKGKKKYYVRIRTYKTVKVNGKNTKIYSVWSKAKTVTTKK